MFNINGFWLLVFGFVILFITGASNVYAENKGLPRTQKFLLGLMWGSSMILFTLIAAVIYFLN